MFFPLPSAIGQESPRAFLSPEFTRTLRDPVTLEQASAHLVKSQTVDILGFVGYMVSAAITQFYHCRINEVNKVYIYKNKQWAGFGLQFADPCSAMF